jgi:succinyl-CoA synthetase alpha subunit
MRAGNVGIVSKSGTLTYEVIDGLDCRGLGESTVICLGGDPVVGTRYAEVLRAFAADPQTEAVVLIGEIGGVAEVAAAEAWREMGGKRKPLVAYIAGQAAPAGKQMGHAGAIIGRGSDTAVAKMQRLRDCGVFVAGLVTDVAATVERALRDR